MNIGSVAKASGLDAKTIRYYESIGLVSEPQRRDNGYRAYHNRQLDELIFLRHARQFGFSIEECRELMQLWRNPQRRSTEVHRLVEEKLQAVEQRLKEIKQMKKLLSDLLDSCPDNDNPECAIIDALARKE